MDKTAYTITKEIRIHNEDGWFYQLNNDGEGCIEFSYYEIQGISEVKQGDSFFIRKDCIQHVINTLEQFK